MLTGFLYFIHSRQSLCKDILGEGSLESGRVPRASSISTNEQWLFSAACHKGVLPVKRGRGYTSTKVLSCIVLKD